MGKMLVGHHLMRVRVRKRMFLRLQEEAEEETERIGENVTVSDLVRRACAEFLNIQRELRQLENPPPELEAIGEVEGVEPEEILIRKPSAAD